MLGILHELIWVQLPILLCFIIWTETNHVPSSIIYPCDLSFLCVRAQHLVDAWIASIVVVKLLTEATTAIAMAGKVYTWFRYLNQVHPLECQKAAGNYMSKLLIWLLHVTNASAWSLVDAWVIIIRNIWQGMRYIYVWQEHPYACRYSLLTGSSLCHPAIWIVPHLRASHIEIRVCSFSSIFSIQKKVEPILIYR